MAVNAFDAFRKYLAVKRHFTSSFDYHKYAGKTNASVSSFEKRPDKYQFSKLAKHPDLDRYLIANLVMNPNMYVFELNEEIAAQRYTAWQKRVGSLSYLFRQEVELLDKDFNKNFEVKDGNHPRLLTLHLSGKLSLETLVILDTLVSFRERWDRSIKEPYIWPEVSRRIPKYRPFLSFDTDKMRQIVLEVIT